MSTLVAADDAERYVCYPIVRPKLWEVYKQMVASFWTVEEVDLSHDRDDWDALAPAQRQWLTRILAFFAVSDGIVGENLFEHLQREITATEPRFVYGIQTFMEQIHAEMYSLLIDTYLSGREKTACFRECVDSPALQEKVRWCQRYLSPSHSLTKRLLAFAVVEGLFFSSSFAAIYYVKKKGKLPGLTFSNELIARDEAMHTEFAALLYREHFQPLPAAEVTALVREGAEVEKRFVRYAMETAIVGLPVEHMCQYVEYVADYLLTMLQCPKTFNVHNPLEFMELISLQGKTNFFEKRVGEYQKANVVHGRDKLCFDQEF
jgi:ribonucleoside-diphosphate reductase beta chain